jgi:hypothetical protein
MAFQHPSEEFVFRLCRASFLSLWSYANPRREGSTKELCDVLVACDPHVLIFSVKYSDYKETEDPNVGASRWLRDTVEDSIKAVYGAERNLKRAAHVTRSDGQPGLPLPALEERRVHRISVSLGGRRLVGLASRDYGKGFVHCFDDFFVEAALAELNTVTDFIAYLEAKEDLLRQQRLVLAGGEEDLLAVYLYNGRTFPSSVGDVIVEENIWVSLLRDAAYQRRLEAEQSSDAWDTLIEYVAEFIQAGQMESGGTLSENELVLRVMVRENRLSRRMLSRSLLDFRERARRGEASARLTPALSGVTYVFYNPRVSDEREARTHKLALRCVVARNEIRYNKTVLGIGFNVDRVPQGYAVDLVYLHFPEWTPKQQKDAEEIKRELGYFRTTQAGGEQVDEYPEA